jgi:biopolymer transport protein ExbD
MVELELMPLLNVFIAIIPLLLMSAAFVPVSVIKTTLPGTGAMSAAAEEPSLDLAIFIRPDGYVVQVSGRITDTVPRDLEAADPAAAFAESRTRLTEVLTAIAAENPGKGDVRIVSQPTTKYEEIIGVMDVCRAAGLPEAALAEAAEGI